MVRQIFDDNKTQKAFEATIQSINKDFGQSGSQVLGDNNIEKIPRTSFGSYKIDELTGGGSPNGRIIEVYGPESSGKTTLALHSIAEHQKKNKLAVFVDAENALDRNYASALGVNVQDLVLAQPDSAEDCLQVTERWVNSGIAGVVVVDSVASMVPEAEIKGEIGDNHVGLLARLMSQALRKLAYACRKSGTTIIFINQLREKVGVMFGNPETTPGGRSLKFYSSIRIDVRPKEIKKTEGVASSRTTKIKISKNKVAPPFREDEVDIEFGEGISKAGEILDFGSDFGLVKKSGAWYSYPARDDMRLGQGRGNAKQFLKDNPEIFEELDNKIREYLAPVEYDEQESEPETQE